MGELAESYAAELGTQLRTLNNFTKHGGEIGRVHEAYLRGVLKRFLPGRYRVGSGFVASHDWTSPQQDVLVFDPNPQPTLFEVGDCVVADHRTVAAAVEVKTELKSDHITVALDNYDRFKDLPLGAFRGLFAWEGISKEAALEALFAWTAKDPTGRIAPPLHAVCVRDSYLIARVDAQGSTNYEPWCVLDSSSSDGERLLSFVSAMWRFSRLLEDDSRGWLGYPWWLHGTWQRIYKEDVVVGEILNGSSLEPWPEEILRSLKAAHALQHRPDVPCSTRPNSQLSSERLDPPHGERLA